MPNIHSQDLLEADQLHAIGLIASEWSLVLAYINVAVWKLLNVDRERGLSVTADMNAAPLIDLFCALFRLKHAGNTALLAELEAMRKRLTDTNTERNNLVHRLWSVSGGALRADKPTARGGTLKVTALMMPTTDLIQKVSVIGILADEFDDFQNQHCA